MRRSLFLIITLICGCSFPEYDYNFNEKWTIIELKKDGERLNDRFQKSSLLQNSVYPAVRFRNSDSTVLWPGYEKKSHKFRFSVDSSFTKISFSRIDSIAYEESNLYMDLICQTYKIEKDDRLGRLNLSAIDGSQTIRMAPTERFVIQGRAKELD